jgi:hypothetical protein
MGDVAFLSLAVAIFAVGALYVAACGRIVGSAGTVETDTDTPESTETRR